MTEKPKLSRKNQKTLDAIFASPTPANIRWAAIETLLTALGAMIYEGSGGSHFSCKLNDVRAVLSRPHQAETPRPYVRQVRTFLKRAGVRE